MRNFLKVSLKNIKTIIKIILGEKVVHKIKFMISKLSGLMLKFTIRNKQKLEKVIISKNYHMVWSAKKLPRYRQDHNFSYIKKCSVIGKTRFIISKSSISFYIVTENQILEDIFNKYHMHEEFLKLADYTVTNNNTLNIKIEKSKIYLKGNWLNVLHPTGENWMHFITECAARLQHAIEKETIVDFGIICDKYLPKQAKDMLQALAPNNKLVEIEHGVECKVEKLIIPRQQTLSTTAFWPRGDFFDHGVFDFNSEALISLRLSLINYFKITAKPFRKLYIRRNSNFRHIKNNQDLELMAIDNGFEIIEPGILSLSEQIRYFHEAKLVIVQAGAAVANIIFMQPDTKVICLRGDTKWCNPKYFSNYAAIFNVNLSYIKGTIVNPENYDESILCDINHPMNANFLIDQDELFNRLSEETTCQL